MNGIKDANIFAFEKCHFKIKIIGNELIINDSKGISIEDAIIVDYLKFLIDFFENIDNSKFWPSPDREYPPMKMIWDIQINDNDNNSFGKNGADGYGYPENWDVLVQKTQTLIEKTLIN